MKKWFLDMFVHLAGRLNNWLDIKLQNANQRRFAALQKQISANRLISLQKQQKECSHLAGSLGESLDLWYRTSIVWHTLVTGEQIGICLECQRYFFPSDPDYVAWRRRASFNRPSSSGVRYNCPKAEPYLMRSVDLPTSVSLPLPPYKNFGEIDPWLLNEDGSRDSHMRVDFGVTEETIDVIPEEPGRADEEDEEDEDEEDEDDNPA